MSYNLKYCSFIRIILMRLPCLMLCHLDKLRKAETAAQEETNNK